MVPQGPVTDLKGFTSEAGTSVRRILGQSRLRNEENLNWKPQTQIPSRVHGIHEGAKLPGVKQ